MDILLTGGVPWPTIVWTIFIDWVMIICGLVGALVKSRYKWGMCAPTVTCHINQKHAIDHSLLGYWTFGTAAMFYIFFNIAYDGRVHAKRLGKEPYRVYMACGVLTLFLWTLYPVAWGLCEGGNVISPDSEAIFYGVLDLCAKPVFSIMLIVGHWGIDPGRLGLKIRDIDEDPKLFSDGKLGPGEQMAYRSQDGAGEQMAYRSQDMSSEGRSTGIDGHT